MLTIFQRLRFRAAILKPTVLGNHSQTLQTLPTILNHLSLGQLFFSTTMQVFLTIHKQSSPGQLFSNSTVQSWLTILEHCSPDQRFSGHFSPG